MTQLIVIAVILLVACGIGFWLYRRGRKDAESDAMQEITDDAYKATKIREEVDLMSASDVRSALKLRRAK